MTPNRRLSRSKPASRAQESKTTPKRKSIGDMIKMAMAAAWTPKSSSDPEENVSPKRMRMCENQEGFKIKIEPNMDKAHEIEFEDYEPIYNGKNLVEYFLNLKSAVEKVMSLPEIRAEIFKRLPVADLLTCSLVNSTWYKESRRVLRNLKITYAYTSYRQPCLNLLTLNNEIPWMTDVPFNSLQIKMANHDPCLAGCQMGIPELSRYYGNLIRLPLKSLVIDWDPQSQIYGCVAAHFLNKLTQGLCPGLEEIHIRSLGRRMPHKFFSEAGKTLPHLKTFSFKLDVIFFSQMLTRVFPVAPNLEKILGLITVSDGRNDLRCIPEGKYKCVRDFVLDLSNRDDDVLRKFALSNPPLDSLLIKQNQAIGSHEWVGLVRLLMERSCSTLKYLLLHQNDLLSLLRLGLPRFPRVEQLGLRILSQTDQVPGLVSQFRLASNFPRLRKLRIIFRRKIAEDVVSESDLNSENGWKNCSVSEIALDVECEEFSYVIFDFLATRFSGITTFEYSGSGEKFLNPQIWTCFPHLTRFKLVIWAKNLKLNLDALLCGLDPEEVADLQDRGEEYLEQLNIMPRRQSPANMTTLKELRVVLRQYGRLLATPSLPSTFLISKVSGHLMFRRNPWLNVVIECHQNWNFKPLDYLAPYATVSYVTPSIRSAT